MDKYLINLNGMGDSEYCVVDKNTFDWIHDGNDMSFPDFLKDEFRKNHGKDYSSKQSMEDELLDIAESACGNDNDKALTAACCHNYSFSIMDLNMYCKKHNINIVGEYSGLIY